MKSLRTNQQQIESVKLDNNKPLLSSSVNEISNAISILSSIRNNNSTVTQVITASAIIQKEYPNLTLGELQKIILDGLLQKFNHSEQPQYNDIPSLMFWLRKYKKNNANEIF